MDFGKRQALDGQRTPAPDTTRNVEWFERSSTDFSAAGESEGPEPNALLDRFREAGGLVYNGEGDYEL